MQNLPDLFPGFESRRFIYAGRGDFRAHRRQRAAALPAARLSADACDLAPGRAAPGGAVPAHHSRFARLWRKFDAARRYRALCLFEAGDGAGRYRHRRSAWLGPLRSCCGHDRGGRAGYRLALDHPERIEKLVLLDIVPTYDMWHRLTRDLAMQTFHWTFLAQHAPMAGRDHRPRSCRLARPQAGALGRQRRSVRLRARSARPLPRVFQRAGAHSRDLRGLSRRGRLRSGRRRSRPLARTPDRLSGRRLLGREGHPEQDRQPARHLGRMVRQRRGPRHPVRPFPARGEPGGDGERHVGFSERIEAGCHRLKGSTGPPR